MSQMVPFLPCRDGFRIIPANLILNLSKRHEIHLLAFSDGSENEGERRWSQPYCATVTVLAARGEPSLAVRPRHRWTHLEHEVRERLQELRPDVLHMEGARLAPLARLAPEGTFKLLSAHDSLQLRFRDFARHGSGLGNRIRFRILAALARRFEKRWYVDLDRIVVTSELDRRTIRGVVDRVPIEVIPNGVDLDFFRFEPKPERGRVVFTGNMSWPPNEDAACYFVSEILPRIRAQRDDARVAIVGANPSPRVRALERTSGVTVTGTVPDIRPWVWNAEVYVCPLRFGAGVKNKVLEAMALGAPVIGTQRSFTGTPIVDGTHALIAERPDDFAGKVLQVLDDENQRRRLSTEGRRLVETTYTWSSVSKSFENQYAAPGGPIDGVVPAQKYGVSR